MSLAAGQTITWSDLSTTCLNSIKNVCCNIDSYKSVPSILQSGAGQTHVHTTQTGIRNSESKQSFYYYANPVNKIPIVSSSTVNSEWTTFLSAAGINTRSNKVVQACDFTKAMGLYMQFMAHHLKHVYCRLQVVGQSTFTGTKYLANATVGALSPKYSITAIEPGNIPEVSDTDIARAVNNCVCNWNVNYEWINAGILDTNGTPVINRNYLS